MTSAIRLCTILLCAALFSACNTMRFVPQGDALYGGSTINIAGDGEKESKDLKTDLSLLLRPKPNANIFGFRYKLAFYSLVDTPHTGFGFRKFLARQFGEPPVLASEVNLVKNRDVIVNRLENRGYFQARGEFDSTWKGRIMRAEYSLTTGPQYKYRSVTFPADSSAVGKSIVRIVTGTRRVGVLRRSSAPRSLLDTGDAYNLDVIRAERSRIDARLKERGFYYFGPDYLEAVIDTTVGNHQVHLQMVLKNSTPDKAKHVYRIRDVIIYPNFDLTKSEDTIGGRETAKLYEGYHIVDPQERFKPQLFARNMTFTPHERYNRSDHNRSLSRLVSLGTFKFVRADFREVDTTDAYNEATDTTGHYLDAFYLATPQAFKSFRGEIVGLTRSNNATGSELTLSWRHRNLFRGAELITVSGSFGVENQVAGQQNIATLRYGAEMSLQLPKLLSPFKHTVSSEFIPRTRFAIGYEFFTRTTQYTLTSARFQYGYQWKRRLEADNTLTLVNFNLVDSANVSPEFQQRLMTDVTLRRSISRQAIIGSIYNYNYTSQARPNRRRHNWYFNGNIDGSFNLIGALTGRSFNGDGSKEPVRFMRTPISQYIRGEVEGRHYMRLGAVKGPPEDFLLASRLLIGAAYAYGNSTEVPFVKQFFAGGVNSIRAFRARSVGPGTYYGGSAPGGSGQQFFLPDQPGDARFEANTELRFKIIAVLKGAVFVDAGNVWTIREDPSRPGSQLTGKFLSQLAIGTGVGARVDIGFLVARLDVATPIRKPWEEGAAATSGLGKELVFNLAIGYPF
jgi:outer membrane protein assembly factor BamA